MHILMLLLLQQHVAAAAACCCCSSNMLLQKQKETAAPAGSILQSQAVAVAAIVAAVVAAAAAAAEWTAYGNRRGGDREEDSGDRLQERISPLLGEGDRLLTFREGLLPLFRGRGSPIGAPLPLPGGEIERSRPAGYACGGGPPLRGEGPFRYGRGPLCPRDAGEAPGGPHSGEERPPGPLGGPPGDRDRLLRAGEGDGWLRRYAGEGERLLLPRGPLRAPLLAWGLLGDAGDWECPFRDCDRLPWLHGDRDRLLRGGEADADASWWRLGDKLPLRLLRAAAAAAAAPTPPPTESRSRAPPLLRDRERERGAPLRRPAAAPAPAPAAAAPTRGGDRLWDRARLSPGDPEGRLWAGTVFVGTGIVFAAAGIVFSEMGIVLSPAVGIVSSGTRIVSLALGILYAAAGIVFVPGRRIASWAGIAALVAGIVP
ncbi:hypothetical protein, conserved [Eimeria acervulina]|uniref:Uncharacterized protein n=1 Tax=Eimeria acervulina TaxID=5801 RepID=U6GUQ4_EIMAC|nr:hypothetical protein, conserved [Eimeria acervulina]CDI83292.1 hypothetical protein, conserved [Eimeria acervulina]